MALQSPTAGFKTITGYILPERHAVQSNQEDVSESEDEEEGIQPEFLDMKEMDCVSSGGNMFKSSVSASKEVPFMAGNKMYRVEGRFPLQDPWWEVTCTIRQGRHKNLVKGFPFYRLRTDLGSEGRSLVSLFLTACKAQPDFVNMFIEWLPNDRHMDPANVLDVLQDFEDSSPENKAVAEQLKSKVNHSVSWTHVRVASLYPEIMKYLPTLLPGQFMDIINKGRIEHIPETSIKDDPTTQEQNNTNVLAKLEELIKTDVWKLGFNYIMFKKLHLIRCEAQMEAFKHCHLFWSIPVVQRNALLLYTELKRHCRATGSTYADREKLEKKISRETGHQGAWEALGFLVEQGVLIREGDRVALWNLFGYEKGIAEFLRALVEGDPWKIHLDVREVLREAHLDRLRAKAREKHSMTRLRISKADAKTSVSEAQNDIVQEVGFEQIDPAFAQPGTLSMVHNGGMPTCNSPQSYEFTKLTIKEESIISDSSNDSTYFDIDPSTIELDPDQLRAAEMMCANPVTVISGKGGCGKTTVVSLVFKAAMEQQTSDREEVLKACEDFQNDSQGSSNGLLSDVHEEKKESEGSDSDEKPVEVLLTAPTGRAASLLTKRTGFTAYTMHQVLWSFMNTKKDPSGNPHAWKFSKVRVLVVDEGSLVSVQILHSILSMLTKHSELQKFIILGDVRQLPSIEPGNTLCDLFEGLRKIQWAIEMRTNHRAESELIIRNSGLISELAKKRHYSPLEFDATINMMRPSKVPSDKTFIFVKIYGENDRFDLQDAITFLLNEAPGLEGDKLSQFVAFRRMDCELINELCCKHYSKHITRTPKNKLNFQPKDKVCCTKNGYVTEHEKKEEGTSFDTARAVHDSTRSSHDNAGNQSQNEQIKEKKERLCNGEIFFIKDDVTEEESCKKTRYLTLDDDNGRVVTFSYRELQRECKLRHAWARTIHTFQGSEAETIVYVLGDSRAQNWQHVYTAVTRGQKRVYVVGRERDLEGAIKRWITPRNTRLCHFVTNVVSQQGPEDSLTQSTCSQSQVETPVNHNFGPSQSTPVASQTPSRPQKLSRPSCAQNLYKDESGQSHPTSNSSLQEDVAFSQTYSWSPMDSCTEPSKVQNENASELSNHVEDATLLAAVCCSSNECNRGSKRLIPVDTCSTPTKLPKQTTSEESPLGSSRLKLLSITSPSSKSGRQLFPDSTCSHREQP
ncbi:DNA helicase B [Sinocyclocheilus rhinocerous]|uniref:DNA helicase B n=1 Tax=Sinocyclocheilus rhinocerous TaxID=307959 RepID=UPI0007B98007|nr:PREDICTED: DNA helicase B-like [Sinocyclocheilus rhinocerous]